MTTKSQEKLLGLARMYKNDVETRIDVINEENPYWEDGDDAGEQIAHWTATLQTIDDVLNELKEGGE